MTHFVLQVWAESALDRQVEWRGKIHHPASGEARYVRDWPTMLALLETTLTDRPADSVGDLSPIQ